MALMEFLRANLLNTTSMLVVPAANTGTIAYLFDRNKGLGFTSVGFESNSACVISVVFSTPVVLSNILIQNHNLKKFRVYYNSLTANSLHIATTNSQTGTYIDFASVTVSSVDFQLDEAMTTNTDKEIGELILTERLLRFERNPSHRDYNPEIKRKRIRHQMPDGGLKLLQVADKFKGTFDWKFLTTSFHDSLLDLWEDGKPMYFVPFPTTSSWDIKAYEVLWSNDFDFRHSTNDKVQGYEGRIVLEETPSA